MNQDLPEGIPRQVNISGTPLQVKAAGELVRRVILEGPQSIHVNSMGGGPNVMVSIDCPQALVGRVIGSSGAVVKELQARSGAKIQIEQDFPDGVPRKIQISGSHVAVNIATQLVAYVMENGPALPGQPSIGGMGAFGMAAPAANPYGPPGGMGGYGAPQSYGVPQMPAPVSATGTSHVIECTKPLVGRIIGRGGEVINQLQARSGARMQIDQSVIPCRIMITGTPQSIATAAQLVNEIIATAAPTPGGQPMGGYGMPAPAYGGGYPGQQQQQQAYGAPGMGMGQQPYGGYQPQQMQQHVMPQQQQQQPYGAQAYGAPVAQAGYRPQAGAYGAPVAAGYPAAAVQKPVQSPWSEHKTDDGNTYWYNSTTGVSQVGYLPLEYICLLLTSSSYVVGKTCISCRPAPIG